MAAPKVFVSYSRHDRDITQRLVVDLTKAGAEVWVDVDGIQSGNFMQAIDQALMKCDWMVLILSPSALESTYVSQETYSALHRVQQGYMKGVIPVVVDTCQPGSIPPQWDVLQRYDATQDYAAALAGVVRAVGLPVIAADRFQQELADLGFTVHSSDNVEYILPPLCTVPAGEFLMGSDPGQDSVAAKESWTDREKPQHLVTVAAYEIARFPVTVAEYACFVRAGQRDPADWDTQRSKPDHPVVNMMWDDIVAYVAWLSEQSRQRWRLPTEPEWEKSARGTDGLIYPWGDSFDNARCNTWDSGIKSTTPVGNYLTGASPYGAQDMAGNVWEWTSSLFNPYPYTLASEREGWGTRTLHGGSWLDGAKYARAACRSDMMSLPSSFSDCTGFRLVRAAPTS